MKRFISADHVKANTFHIWYSISKRFFTLSVFPFLKLCLESVNVSISALLMTASLNCTLYTVTKLLFCCRNTDIVRMHIWSVMFMYVLNSFSTLLLYSRWSCLSIGLNPVLGALLRRLQHCADVYRHLKFYVKNAYIRHRTLAFMVWFLDLGKWNKEAKKKGLLKRWVVWKHKDKDI